ncbi:hypothetical protein V2J09_011825 [Rumex salicifolius]
MYDHQESSFVRCYRCYSVSSFNKSHLENGDKIYMEIEYPMLFNITNPSTNRTSHCGVMEFVADEGTVLLPSWMMENLLLKEGDILKITTASLPKASYIKLQPHETKFLDISNPKAVLEKTLRQFSCLTIGDTVTVSYNDKKFNINVVEAKPSSAVSVIETDCEVDFSPPLDYKEPEKQLPSVEKSQCEEEPGKEAPKFVAFTGVSRRLDGLSSMVSSVPIAQAMEEDQQQQPSSSSVSRRRAGKIVFGSSSDSGKTSKKPNVAEEVKSEVASQKDEKPKFQAFTGKSYKLI